MLSDWVFGVTSCDVRLGFLGRRGEGGGVVNPQVDPGVCQPISEKKVEKRKNTLTVWVFSIRSICYFWLYFFFYCFWLEKWGLALSTCEFSRLE